MKTKSINHKYDPVSKVLTYYDGLRPTGFLKGDPAENEVNQLMMQGVDIIFTDMNSSADKLRKLNIHSLMSIWSALGIQEMRQVILDRYELKSTTQLSDSQLEFLVDHFGNGPKKQVDDETRKLRSEVLTILTRLQVYKTNQDWKRVNAYLLNKKIAGALLFELDKVQLKALSRKLRSIEGKNARIMSEIRRQQLMN